MTNSSEEKVWVSDIISDDYMRWHEDVILLGFGTGRGKTTFALNTYCKYLIYMGQKVVYLCNRTKLKEQIIADAEKYGAGQIDIMSYQKMAESIRYGYEPNYDVYICDEAHFFLADGVFNLYTDISYDYILKQQTSTRVYMTATYQNIFTQIKKDLEEQDEKFIEYYLPTDYSYVENIYWWKKKDDLYGIIDHLLTTTDDKIIYFCNSLKKMREVYSHYSPNRGKAYLEEDEKFLKDSQLQYMSFLCSESYQKDDEESQDDSTKRKKKRVLLKDEEEKDDKNNFIRQYCSMEHLIKNPQTQGYTFDNRILITTKVLDNGLDFKDEEIRHVICDIFDLESAIQCLGRKRILNKNDTCNFYIRDWQHNQLNLFLAPIKESLKSSTMFFKDNSKWIHKYGTNREYKDNTIYFDFDMNEHRVNRLRYQKLLSDQEMINAMIGKRTSYRKEIMSYLGDIPCINLEDMAAAHVRDAIEIWVERHKGQYLSEDEKQELISLCDLKDKYGRRQKSIGIIAHYLNDNYEYTVINKQHRIDGKRIKEWVVTHIQKENNSNPGKLPRPP